VDINVSDHLTESEMKYIATSVFEEACREKFNKDHERLISNAGYEVVVKIIKQHYPEGLEQKVAEKSVEVINNLTPLTLFGPKNAWDRETTGGMEALQNAIKENKKLINDKAIQLIKRFSCSTANDYIESILREEILERLFGGKNES
jgi:hypothetical protein